MSKEKRKVLELSLVKEVFEPYSSLWNKWKSTEECFLKKDDIIILETYLKTGELKEACKLLKISNKKAIEELNRVTFTLYCGESIFFSWMLKVFYLESRNWFINLPISKTPIPVYYRKRIAKLKCSNLKEALEKYTSSDFYRLWSKEAAEDFIELMEHYQCGSLLRMGSNN